jgi:hypothetical protein
MRPSTFDLYLYLHPGGWGGAWGAGYMGTPASYESLPAPSGHTDSHTLDTYIWGGRALILDRCRAFDLFSSVHAHLCTSAVTALMVLPQSNTEYQAFFPVVRIGTPPLTRKGVLLGLLLLPLGPRGETHLLAGGGGGGTQFRRRTNTMVLYRKSMFPYTSLPFASEYRGTQIGRQEKSLVIFTFIVLCIIPMIIL